MDTTIQRLNTLIERATDYFPEGQDIKGFSGISRLLITESLHKYGQQMELLKPYDKEFEAVVLKRELAELFEKIEKQMEEKFIRLKPGEFNNILRNITRIGGLVRQTYISLSNDLPIRTEAEITQAKTELEALKADSEFLKTIKPELTASRDISLAAIETMQAEVKTKNEVAVQVIDGIQTEVNDLKKTTIQSIVEMEQGIKTIETNTTSILTSMEARQQTAIANEEKTAAFMAEVEKYKTSIEKTHEEVEGWSGEISNTKDAIAKNEKAYLELNNGLKKTIGDLDKKYLTIAGGQDGAGKPVKGYIKETEELMKRLDDFYTAQNKKYQTQFDHIESLLPGATSAGLAKAYQDQKASYTWSIRGWSAVFVISVVVMAILGYQFIVEQLATTDSQTFIHAIISILKELPFFIPAIWLASFASKQQSQARRMQEEYAFKETNAKSFHGHKQQIEALMKDKVADKELLAELVAQLVHITGENPSHTLESKIHSDDSPMLKFLGRMMKKKEKQNGVQKDS